MNIQVVIGGYCGAQRQAIADNTARLVKKHGQTLNLDAAVLADLEQGLADVNHLEPPERLLEKLALSA
uniref:Uncharacterized protein n=1 Tax=Candidatus Kentrum sp. FM TaxID=2126340 RepID=A0A450VR89_9GAMM|nr:MAG: hypothetical protein BECKFM1743C_GA0114222_1002911 [Candidatus Kentron sp. FM]VFJ46310.1 MAG: hypothetical protein BECKFM1743A_GA0114220_1003512 [Candidatus Kentron sp. FM]VFK07287.1 MAG: hypothetical protein BECKFM1743B_GA0114221_1003613 [Candidatus Kentron sp. FM]